MISMPAFWGDLAEQTAILQKISSLDMALAHQPSLLVMLGDGNLDLKSLHDQTGFSVSLLLICDAVFVRLATCDAKKFALDLFSSVTPGINTAYMGWAIIELALANGVEKYGEAFVDAARMAPDIFIRLSVPAYSKTQLVKFAKRADRIAEKLRQEPPAQEDPRVIALLAACGRGGDAHAGKVIGWYLDQSTDQDQALNFCAGQLRELLQAA